MIPTNAKVFPLKHNLKEPATIHAHLNAITYDPEKIEITDNYGISLDNQWLVVDFDCPEYHPERIALEDYLSLLPATWTQTTLKPDGRHYLYSVPEGFTGKNGKITGRDGVHIADVKVKGYIVGPGSKVDGKAYSMLNPIQPSPASETLLNLVLAPSRDLRNDFGSHEEFSGVPKGKHSDYYTSLAGHARRQGLDSEAIYQLLISVPTSLLLGYDPSDPFTESYFRSLANSMGKKETNVTPPFTIKVEDNYEYDSDFDLPILDWYIHDFILKGGYLMTGFGDAGIGKSSFGHFVAARVTQMGDNFMVVNHEDSPKYWKACAIVAGADGSKLIGYKKPFDLALPDCIEELEEGIAKHNIKFIWFDAIKDHMPKGDRGGDAQEIARAGLSPLADLATRTGCLIFGLFHTNKKHMPGGSTSFLDVARHVLEFKKNPNGTLAVLVEKSNISIPEYALRMFGEKKPLVDPRDPNRSAKSKSKDGTISTRTVWIASGYEEDSKLLNEIREGKEKENLSQEVVRLHKEEGLTQAEIAKKFGKQQPWVSKMLSYNKSIKLEDLS
jgi:hypothetical protein